MNSFLFNHIRFQIAATTLLVILDVIYFFRPKIKLLSNRIFSILMISASCYLIFDYATVFALVYYDDVPSWFVRFTHQGFIFFLDIVLSCIYLYMDTLNHNQKRLSRYKLYFIILLYVLSFLTLIFAPIEYYIAEDGIYSYGMMVNCVYTIIILYSALTVLSSIKNFKKSSHKRQLSYALATMALWIGFGVTQIFLPAILISSVGISSMILLMFLSLENPSEYIDRETSTFNHYAFKSVLAEFMAKSDPFTVITLGMDDTKIIESQADNDIIVNLFMLVKKFISKTFRTDIYRISSTSLALIFSEKQWKTAEGKLSALEERFNDGWLLQNRSIHIRAHVNVIRCPEDFSFSEKFSDVLDFIENCDTYSSAKGFIRMGDESARRNKLRQSAIIRLLTKTIETGEIEMFYQPIYSIREKKFTNVEALVRLRDDKSLGYVSPEEFIPLAERNALIMPLSSLIFNRIFKFMHDNEIDKKGVHHMEVNLSGLQSVDTEFPVLMKDLLTKYAINPENVNLEVTESIAITSGYMLKKNMDELRKFGCSFSMDDFGTGYSNLSQISKVDFEVIKIDKSLLWPCFQKNGGDTGNAKILLETMINMILQMGRKIVVEGIETKEQFDYLASLGVNYAQGYYFSRPVPENAYLKFLADNS